MPISIKARAIELNPNFHEKKENFNCKQSADEYTNWIEVYMYMQNEKKNFI